MIFNATNVHITVNNNWLNEAVSISWQQQGGVEPLYGYKDVEFRTVAQRSNIVAGTIGIYYTDHDYFFRYLSKSSTGTRPEDQVNRAIEDAAQEVRSAEGAGELATLLGNLDLTQAESDYYIEALFNQYNVNPDESSRIGSSRIRNSDVLGEEGYKLQKEVPRGAPGEGSTVTIWYGDLQDRESQTLHNVWIIGRAPTPIENSPRQAAEPLMEFWSFIASRVERS